MNIPNKREFSLPFFGREITFTLADVAGQANAAVIGQYGDTSVLVTVVMGKEDRAVDFFPLTVDYEERFYAAGKIIGSRFVRREGRPSQDAVLSGRLIDRTIRPLFDERLRRDVQLVVTILSYDDENDPDFIALLTASLALSISDIPWAGPVAGVRSMKNEAGIIFNPLNSQLEKGLAGIGSFESFFAGTKSVINMIELAGKDAAEADVEKVFAESFSQISKLIEFQESIVKEAGKPKATVALMEPDAKMVVAVRSFAEPKLQEVLYIVDRAQRDAAIKQVRSELSEHLIAETIEASPAAVLKVWEAMVNEIVHKNILSSERRPDSRPLTQVRPLSANVALFKRLHGSALFTRGATQSLAVTTLAAPGSEQIVETMESTGKRRFMLHYNFPPYSTGETGRFGVPGRREIGHGALAEKALRGVIPSQEQFPYTIRLVSEILSSNGSSSMATVCAGTLSLMDAGVPIRKPVAGIAMGLMTHQGYDPASTSTDYKVLTDIQGPEDHYGDMDCKVAGTRDGITAVQMDVKIEGITPEIFSKALAAAKAARYTILDLIEATLPAPRAELSPYAPIIRTLSIDPSQIGLVIGSGGKTINGIIEQFGISSIDINDDGAVFVSGTDRERVEAAADHIRQMTRELTPGDIITGKVVRLMDFGAIVDLGGGKDGMVHVSEMKYGYVQKASDVLKLDQDVTVKVLKVEDGKVSLSIKALLPKPQGGEEPRGPQRAY
jgi:polyribonucleotide nucleotidyltransferase